MKWTKEELKLLKKNYTKLSRTELEKLLPHRTWQAIVARACVEKVQRQKDWTKDEIDYLVENFPVLGAQGCCKVLSNRSKESIQVKANKLGLILTRNLSLEGKTFGYLLVEKLIIKNIKGKNKRYWQCKCKCGNTAVVLGCYLRQGQTKSCGCYANEKRHLNHYKGGQHISGTEYATIKNNALKRNLKFEINIQDIENIYEKQNKKCTLSGIDISFNSGKKHGKYIIGNASVDRIDGTKGYTIDNIQIVDQKVNYAKCQLSDRDFIAMCCRVADYQRNK